MLVAHDELGRAVQATETLIKAADYSCPSCLQRVILKCGTQKLPHFAHQKQSCPSLSEPETLAHLMSKQWLYEWSQSGILEAYLPQLQQRPDLLVDRVAIEVQCSALALPRFIERTCNYLQNNYQPWWLLGKKLLPKKRWSSLVKACVYLSEPHRLSLWHVDGQQRRLYLYDNITWHYTLTYQYQKQLLDERNGELLTVFQQQKPMSTSTHSDWQTSTFQQTLQIKLQRAHPKITKIQSFLYSQRAHICFLPEWCYAPSCYFFFFEEYLLLLRFYYLQTVDFSTWLRALRQISWTWLYPLVSQKKILQAIYAECQTLALG